MKEKLCSTACTVCMMYTIVSNWYFIMLDQHLSSGGNRRAKNIPEVLFATPYRISAESCLLQIIHQDIINIICKLNGIP